MKNRKELSGNEGWKRNSAHRVGSNRILELKEGEEEEEKERLNLHVKWMHERKATEKGSSNERLQWKGSRGRMRRRRSGSKEGRKGGIWALIERERGVTLRTDRG